MAVEFDRDTFKVEVKSEREMLASDPKFPWLFRGKDAFLFFDMDNVANLTAVCRGVSPRSSINSAASKPALNLAIVAATRVFITSFDTLSEIA